MARRRKDRTSDETLVDIVEVKESTQDYFEKNQNTILGGLLLLVLVVGGWFAYNNFYQAPRQQEAIEMMRQAEQMFEQDSFALALENPGNGGLGFLQIIDDYSGTATSNTANYYAGISWLNLGKYDAAISHLEDFSTSDYALSITKYGAIGDAYAEKGQMDDAISNYKKAVNQGDNELLTAFYLKKLGILYQSQGKMDEAKAAFQQIKDNYPNSPDARDIDRYLSMMG